MQRDNTLESHQFGASNFQYSAARIDDLTAPEYTIVTLIVDESGSTVPFRDEMEKCIKSIVLACRQSPRADYLLLRLVAFSTTDREVHGYKLLETCDLDDYNDVFRDSGTTLLFDTVKKSVDALGDYARQLRTSDYGVNGIVIVMTDGLNTHGSYSPQDVGNALKNSITSESLESLISILVGVNLHDKLMSDKLDEFSTEAGFDRFVSLTDASPTTLAKLAEFVSKSIASQSQAIGTGGPSQAIQSLTI